MKNQIKIESVSDIKELSHVTESGCWNWRGPTRASRGGKDVRGIVRGVYVYRMAWELKHQAIIGQGLFARHACDNPLCVNPDHIELGTHKDNGNDAAVRGTAAHKVTNTQVLAILASAERLGPTASSVQILADVGDASLTRHHVYNVVTRGHNKRRVSANVQSVQLAA